MPRATSRSPWPRIDAWLKEHAPHVLEQLNPPADAAALADLAAAVGDPLPAPLLDAWRAHDGARDEFPAVLAAVRAPRMVQWIRWMHWLPVGESRARLEELLGLGVDWIVSDVPFAEDGGGNVLVVDAGSGAVSVWDHETNELIPVAEEFGAWMSALANDMDARLVALEDEDEGEELVLLDAPRPKEPAAPETGPRRFGRTFVEELAQRRMIALVRGAELEPLFDQLGKALGERNAKKRLDAVLEVLTENDAVEEFFADDETLAELLEEFV